MVSLNGARRRLDPFLWDSVHLLSHSGHWWLLSLVHSAPESSPCSCTKPSRIDEELTAKRWRTRCKSTKSWTRSARAPMERCSRGRTGRRAKLSPWSESDWMMTMRGCLPLRFGKSVCWRNWSTRTLSGLCLGDQQSVPCLFTFLWIPFDRLYDVLHSDKKLTLVFEHCDQDLKVLITAVLRLSFDLSSFETEIFWQPQRRNWCRCCEELHVSAFARTWILPQVIYFEWSLR